MNAFRAPPSEGGDFEKVDPGMHAGQCVGMFDRGSHFNEKSQKFSRKITLIFNLSTLDSEGKHFEMFSNYTFSMFEGSYLRKAIESWFGKRFDSNEDAAAFDLSKLLSRKAYLNVVHNTSGNSTYANIETIVPLPPAMKQSETFPEFEPLLFSLDAFDQVAFNRLPDKIKEKIQQCQEWGSIEADASTDAPAQSGDNSDFEDDDIPF